MRSISASFFWSPPYPGQAFLKSCAHFVPTTPKNNKKTFKQDTKETEWSLLTIFFHLKFLLDESILFDG
jgi:hypothetical protein